MARWFMCFLFDTVWTMHIQSSFCVMFFSFSSPNSVLSRTICSTPLFLCVCICLTDDDAELLIASNEPLSCEIVLQVHISYRLPVSVKVNIVYILWVIWTCWNILSVEHYFRKTNRVELCLPRQSRASTPATSPSAHRS